MCRAVVDGVSMCIVLGACGLEGDEKGARYRWYLEAFDANGEAKAVEEETLMRDKSNSTRVVVVCENSRCELPMAFTSLSWHASLWFFGARFWCLSWHFHLDCSTNQIASFGSEISSVLFINIQRYNVYKVLDSVGSRSTELQLRVCPSFAQNQNSFDATRRACFEDLIELHWLLDAYLLLLSSFFCRFLSLDTLC